MGTFVAAGFVAAMLSTIDGLLLAASQAVTWDITARDTVRTILGATPETSRTTSLSDGRGVTGAFPEAGSPEQGILVQTRYWVLALALVGGGLTFWFTTVFHVSIFDLVYIVVTAQMILLPSVLTVLFGRRVRRAAGFLSIGVGLIVGILLVGYGIVRHDADLLTWSPVIALAAAFVAWMPSLWTGEKA